MTNTEAAQRLNKVLEHAKAGKSCHVEEEALEMAIRALQWADCLAERLETELEVLDE